MSIPTARRLSPRAICVELNRLIKADFNESLALGAAALVIRGGQRRQLLQQALRRSVFRDDLRQSIVALGGTPAKNASYRAKISRAAFRFRQILTGGHDGDAYASCVRATEKTSDAYLRALRAPLPADVRFGVERELAEIEWDRAELTRLRFGARPAPSAADGDAAMVLRARNNRSDERAVEAWDDEGGA